MLDSWTVTSVGLLRKKIGTVFSFNCSPASPDPSITFNYSFVNLLVISPVRCYVPVFGNSFYKCMQHLEKITSLVLHTVTGRHEVDRTWNKREKLDSSTAQQQCEVHSLNFAHEIRCNIRPEPLSSKFQVKSSVCSRAPDRALILHYHS